MNAQSLKKIYENMPRGIKQVFAPFFLRTILGNPIYKETMKSLDEYDRMSQEEQDKKCLEELKRVLVYAYEHTAYYKRVFDERGFDPHAFSDFSEMEKLPLMDKATVVEHWEELISDEKIDSYETSTSGSSTGKVFKILLEKASIYKERAFVNHYLEKLGYDSKKSRMLSFWGHNKDADYYYSPMKNEIIISPFRLFNETDFEKVWRDVKKFDPQVVAGYASSVHHFAQLVNQHGKSIHFDLVDFYAENFTDEIREYVKETFGCEVGARYGHTERQVFAELYDGRYVFNKLYGYTEFVPYENGEETKAAQIVCTGFLSKTMPLIRYITDDAVVKDEKGYQIQGHKTSEARVIAKNGAEIYKGMLVPHTDIFSKVSLYQFVQYEPGKAFLDVVVEKSFTPEELKEIQEFYKRRCEGLLDVEIREVDKVILSKKGKYSWLVSYIGK